VLRGETAPCRQIPRDWLEMKKSERAPTARKRPYS
jgi:hypothetical protein